MLSAFSKIPLSVVAGAVAGGLTAGGASVAHASGFQLPPVRPEWFHNSSWAAFYDNRALRRGYEVYRQVCSTCHSMNYIHFRNLVGVTHTEEQAKMLARTYEYVDGPDDQGQMFERPGRLTDAFPSPYDNDEAGRLANNGALPPDLSLIVKARENAEDYIYSLLTGYRQPPAGVTLRPGLHYNPYFPDGAIGMAPPLTQDTTEFFEYEDGTPVSVPQMAKDVTVFLAWAGEPENNQRKLQLSKYVFALTVASTSAFFWKTYRWSIFKHRKFTWVR